MTLPWTLALLALGLALAGLARWQETPAARARRGAAVPGTLVLAIGVIAAVLAAAHLVSLLTGIPLKGATRPERARLAELRHDGNIKSRWRPRHHSVRAGDGALIG